MDNLGIFKLLNSFYDFMNKNKGESSDNSSISKPAEKGQKDSDFSPSFAPAGGKNGDGKDERQGKVTPTPLQAGMLNTLTSHDAFVQRVMKNKKEP